MNNLENPANNAAATEVAATSVAAILMRFPCVPCITSSVGAAAAATIPPVDRVIPIDPRTLLDVRLRVAAVIEELRPGIQEDDGDVELVDVTPEGQVQVRFKGACVRCPSSGMTLHGGIEKNLRAIVPEVESVISVP